MPPQYFQVVRAFSPLGTGVRLLPAAASTAASSVAGTRLAVRAGNKIVVGTGMACYSAAFLWISATSPTTSYLVIAAQMVVLGTGMGLTTAPATEAVMGAVPIDKAGAGSAVNDATRLFGATLGVAVIGSVAATVYASHLAPALPPGLPATAITAARGSVGGAAEAAQRLARAGLAGPARHLGNAATGAFMHSLAGGCLVAACAAAAGALLALVLLPARPRAQQTPARPAAAIPPRPAAAGQGDHPGGGVRQFRRRASSRAPGVVPWYNGNHRAGPDRCPPGAPAAEGPEGTRRVPGPVPGRPA